jgi:hypothetical protein
MNVIEKTYAEIPGHSNLENSGVALRAAGVAYEARGGSDKFAGYVGLQCEQLKVYEKRI